MSSGNSNNYNNNYLSNNNNNTGINGAPAAGGASSSLAGLSRSTIADRSRATGAYDGAGVTSSYFDRPSSYLNTSIDSLGAGAGAGLRGSAYGSSITNRVGYDSLRANGYDFASRDSVAPRVYDGATSGLYSNAAGAGAAGSSSSSISAYLASIGNDPRYGSAAAPSSSSSAYDRLYSASSGVAGNGYPEYTRAFGGYGSAIQARYPESGYQQQAPALQAMPYSLPTQQYPQQQQQQQQPAFNSIEQYYQYRYQQQQQLLQQQQQPLFPQQQAPVVNPAASLFRPPVLVVGATGSVGEATIKALCAKYAQTLDIRAGVRDVEKARAKYGNLPGLQIVHADMSKPETLTKAMQGVDRVFCVVPPSADRTQLAIACGNAAVQSGVRFLLMLSVLSVEIPNTVFANQFTPVENHVKQLRISSAMIRLPMFFENNFGNKQSIQAQGTIYGPSNGAAKCPAVAVQDVGECAAAILADPARHNGRIYKLLAPPVSGDDIAAAFSRALGRPIRYQQIPYEQAQQAFAGAGLLPHQVDGVLELYRLVDSASPAIQERDIYDIDRILGRSATTFDQWAYNVRAAFAAPAAAAPAAASSPQPPAAPANASSPQPPQQPAAARRMPVLVVGATGNVGDATLKALSAKYAQTLDIRAGVRDVNKARAKYGNLPGVQIVHADMSQPHTLGQAMQGVDRVFCIVPPTPDRAQQAIACANAAVQSGVRFLLMLSVLSAEVPNTVFNRQFGPIEAHVKQLRISSAMIRLPMFFENNFGNKQSIQAQGTMYGPGNSQARYSSVAVQDVGECAAAILADPARHNGHIYKLVAPQPISGDEVAASFSRALGRPIRYQQVPYEQAQQAFLGSGLQQHQVDGVLELFRLIDAGAPVMNERDVQDIDRILGRPGTTIDQWTQNVRGAFQ